MGEEIKDIFNVQELSQESSSILADTSSSDAQNTFDVYSDATKYISEDFEVLGYRVKQMLAGFFNSSYIPSVYKDQLSSYLHKIRSEDYLLLSLTMNGFLCKKLIETTINNSNNEVLHLIKHMVEVKPSSTHKTFTAKHKKDENKLLIYVNPMFASALETKSLEKALAHEMIHHRNNHYTLMTDAISKWLDKNEDASNSRMLEIRSLAEIAVDCVANDVVDADKLRVNGGAVPSDLILLSTAVLFGSGVRHDEKGFYIPLFTIASINGRYHLNIKSGDSIKYIFERLVEVTK